MRFAYARTGGPLLNWSGPTPPSQTRAGETRSLGAYYPTSRTSSALRRYGGRPPANAGSAVGYEVNRSLGALDIPRPGAPEIIEGYESPAPGAAIIHLGEECTWDLAHRRSHGMSGFIPEGAVMKYGQMLGADAPTPALEPKPAAFDTSLIRKASAIAGAFHGVKRHNGSVMWGLLWAAAAYVTPLYGALVPAFAVAQGYGRPKP